MTPILDQLFFLVTFLPLMYSQDAGESCSSNNPPSGPVTINTFGACASAEMETRLKIVEDMVTQMHNQGNDAKGDVNRMKDCVDVYNSLASGGRNDGVYDIWPEGAEKPFKVWCSFDSEGLWTEVHRRQDGGVNFQRNWFEYKRGFGSPAFNFWLGLDNLHALTTQRQYTLRIDLYDWDNLRRTAIYRNFYIAGETDNYRLFYHLYTPTGSSDAGDALGTYHYGANFSTFDRDNDRKSGENCAEVHGGGWWYRDCDHANLNGMYVYNGDITTQQDTGIEWDTWKARYSFKKVITRVKPTFNV